MQEGSGLDSRAEAASRAGVSQRVLKKQMRSRQRAAENRKEERKKAAAARIEREREESSDEDRMDVWAKTDDCLDDLTYAPGTWFCARCGTANPPVGDGTGACGGWLKGESCSGTFSRDFKRWAPAKSVPQKGKRRREKTTKLEQLLQQESWICSRCQKGNLCFRAKCYQCSLERPSKDTGDASDTDDDYGPKPSDAVEASAEKFLREQRQELGLRRQRKRGGAKHKKKEYEEKAFGSWLACGEACVSPLSRGQTKEEQEEEVEKEVTLLLVHWKEGPKSTEEGVQRQWLEPRAARLVACLFCGSSCSQGDRGSRDSHFRGGPGGDRQHFRGLPGSHDRRQPPGQNDFGCCWPRSPSCRNLVRSQQAVELLEPVYAWQYGKCRSEAHPVGWRYVAMVSGFPQSQV